MDKEDIINSNNNDSSTIAAEEDFHRFLTLIIRYFQPIHTIETEGYPNPVCDWLAGKFPFLNMWYVEGNQANFSESSERLSNYKNITMQNQNAEEFLQEWLPIFSIKSKCLFLLNIRDESEEQLQKELNLISDSQASAVIIINYLSSDKNKSYDFINDTNEITDKLNKNNNYLSLFQNSAIYESSNNDTRRLFIFQNCEDTYYKIKNDGWAAFRFINAIETVHKETLVLETESINEILLSVLIPCYNRHEALKQCLDSLKNQTIGISQFEVICVNDGSNQTEIKEIIVDALEVLNGKYIEHEVNKGRAAARNTALAAASGKYLMFMDSDIDAAPNLLEEHLKAHNIEPHKKYAVLSRIKFTEKQLKQEPLAKVFDESTLILGYAEMKPGFNCNYLHFYTGNISIPKVINDEIGGFDESYKNYGVEDTENGYRI
ncbi:MAG: hypothetical protein QG635_1446 [Bacteroidota bacterium]|nr:hypothetical protein [Bacteroidota bacterium]